MGWPGGGSLRAADPALPSSVRLAEILCGSVGRDMDRPHGDRGRNGPPSAWLT